MERRYAHKESPRTDQSLANNVASTHSRNAQLYVEIQWDRRHGAGMNRNGISASHK